MDQLHLTPVARAERIDILDILRGIAILGIFYMNIPSMAAPIMAPFGAGGSHADAVAWGVTELFLEGTQRGLLQFLFGAGMMVIAARAMEPDAPVAVADLYYRRNLWLLVFGLFDIFAVLWLGDILFIYALAALALFPFRRVAPRWLLLLGLTFAGWTAINGAVEYADRADLTARIAVARTHQAAHQPLTQVDRDALARADRQAARRQPDRAGIAAQEKARAAGPLAYARWTWTSWYGYVANDGQLAHWVVEAFCAMLIGVALWKWRITQGGRSARFYLLLMLSTYLVGLVARGIDLGAIIRQQTTPKSLWITEEFARLAVTVGHLAAINLLAKARGGRALLAPFKAAGRTAFSLYFLTSLLGIWLIFAPWGFGWFGRYGPAGQTAIATGVIAVLLVVANIWVRFFANGPLEWLWRSLSYGRRQPFRIRREMPPAALPV